MAQPAPPADTQPERYWALDVYRGICALVVFLCHWHLWSNFAPHGPAQQFLRYCDETLYLAFIVTMWPTGGLHPAVIGFFVLSGFCIHYRFALDARREKQPDWKNYYQRRFRRIVPVYWAAAILGLIFVAAEKSHPSGNELLQVHAAFDVTGTAARLTALEGFYPHEVFSGNYILVTVAAEILLYLVYPLFHRFAIRGAWLGLGIFCVGLNLAIPFLMPLVSPYWLFNSAVNFALFWYMGALAAHLFVSRGPLTQVRWPLFAWFLFLGVKALPYFHGLNLVKQLLWGLVCMLALLWVLSIQRRRPALINRPGIRALRYAGLVSYSLYAVHTPAMMLASWSLLTLAGNANYFLQVAATLVFSATTTLLVHYGIERRFYRMHF